MTGRPLRVLVVEDDPSILLGLRLNLEGEGYQVSTATDGDTGLRLALDDAWDLLLLDLMLPGRNGFEILQELRHRGDERPVVVLTARATETDTVMGLDLGADDYVTKPFAIGELLARVRAALRRRRQEPDPTAWRFGAVEVDADRREVRRDGVELELTATEFDVLATLLLAAGGALSRRQIMDRVWGSDHHGTTRTIDNFVAQLRAKLEEDPSRPDHLKTVRGVGYRLAGLE